MIDYGYGVTLSKDINFQHSRLVRNQYEIRRWCRQVTLISPDQQDRWIDHITSDPTIEMFSVRNPTLHQIGVCGLTTINNINQNAEVSLYINRDEQRKKNGTKALKTLLRHGFEDFNLNCIWGETWEHNPARSMFKRVGFKEEGVLRQRYFKEGRFINTIPFSMLREEFNKEK